MSDRLSFLIVVILLLTAAVLRFEQFTTLPAGLQSDEITNIRISETARSGTIEVFYDIRGQGREGLFQIAQAFVTATVGNGTMGYRMLPAWLGLLAIAATYAAGKRLIGNLGGVSAAGLLAVSLWPILLSRQNIPDAALPLLMALVILSTAQALPVYRRKRQRNDSTTTAAALGLALGLGIYVHPVGMLILGASLVYIVYIFRTGVSLSRRRLSYIGFTLLIVLTLAVPYLVSSIRHPNLGGIERLTGDQAQLSVESIIKGLGGMILHGDTNAVHNLTGRPLFDPFSAQLILIGIAWALIKRHEPRYILLIVAAVLLSPVVVFSANAPNFLNYAAVLPLLALFFGVGVSALFSNLPRLMQGFMALLLIALLGANIGWTQRDLMDTWPDDPAVQIAYHSRLGWLAAHIDRTADDIPTVICGWRANQSPSAPQFNDAQLITLMLNRSVGLSVRYANCQQALIFTEGGAEQQIILPDPDILQNANPEIRRWLDQGVFRTDSDIPPQGVLVLDTTQALADYLGQVTTNSPAQYAPEVEGASADPITTPISFGENLTFLGYRNEDPARTYAPGDFYALTTYWRAQGRVPSDLRLFTHILADPAAIPVAQTDITEVNPRYLRDRDVFVQVTTVPLPESLPTGEYTISIGGYQDTSDQRLGVLEHGETRGTRLFIGVINVQTE